MIVFLKMFLDVQFTLWQTDESQYIKKSTLTSNFVNGSRQCARQLSSNGNSCTERMHICAKECSSCFTPISYCFVRKTTKTVIIISSFTTFDAYVLETTCTHRLTHCWFVKDAVRCESVRVFFIYLRVFLDVNRTWESLQVRILSWKRSFPRVT